ncbi:MAG: hypothetical protein WDN26_06425 [Chitinophagaceae bacterium]
MKSTLTRCLAIALFFTATACNNDTKTEETKVVPVETKPAPPKEKTEVSVGPNGAEVKTKDANIKFNTKDTTKK